MKRYYITSPIYYVNAAPHIGHSYTQVAIDSIKRFMLQRGREAYFLTGSDEHGEKIEKAAIAAGFKPGEEKQFVDTIIPRFKGLWEKLGIEYDQFIRTTDKVHEDAVKHMLTLLHAKGDIYKKVYKGWYCTPCEMFWSFAQAPDGICQDCKRPIEKLDEENYFFKMSKYQEPLIKAIESGELKILPDIRRNEVLSFLKGNELQDLCISRSKKRLKWGIEFPFDKEYVAYVWVDALVNYASAAGYPNDRTRFDSLWPADMHVIGKDILRHHAVYWPILLMAIGEKLPKKVFAHGWWVTGGEKMSKSKGNVVDPIYLIEERKFSPDALKYFLLSQVQFGYDGSFSEELFIEKYNSDLANNFGNLVNRSLTMIEKYFAGKVPLVNERKDFAMALGGDAKKFQDELIDISGKLPEQVDKAMDIDNDGPDFQGALKEIWTAIDKANKYIEISAPWKHSKNNDMETVALIMYNLAQSLGLVSVMLYPFMPASAKNVWEQLGSGVDIKEVKYNDVKWGFIKPGTLTKKAPPLFPRVDKEK